MSESVNINGSVDRSLSQTLPFLFFSHPQNQLINIKYSPFVSINYFFNFLILAILPHSLNFLTIWKADLSSSMHFSLTKVPNVNLTIIPCELSLSLHCPIFKGTFIDPILCFHFDRILCDNVPFKLAFVKTIFFLENSFSPHVTDSKFPSVCFAIVPCKGTMPMFESINESSFIFISIFKLFDTKSMRFFILPISCVSVASVRLESPFPIFLRLLKFSSIITTFRIDEEAILSSELTFIQISREECAIFKKNSSSPMRMLFLPLTFVIQSLAWDIIASKLQSLNFFFLKLLLVSIIVPCCSITY